MKIRLPLILSKFLSLSALATLAISTTHAVDPAAVLSTNDNGPGTLRTILDTSPSGQVIYVLVGEINLNTQIAFDRPEDTLITITGAGYYQTNGENPSLSATDPWQSNPRGGFFLLGDAIWTPRIDFVLTNLNFTNGTAQYEGGAVYSFSGKLQITNCNFTGNRTGFDTGVNIAQNGTGGGAIVFLGTPFGHDNFIINTHFEDNHSNNGGAVYVHNNGNNPNTNGALRIENCTFTANIAQMGNNANDSKQYANGGAINLKACILDIKSTYFSRNVAYGTGGAIDAHLAAVRVSEHSTFDGNKVTGEDENYGGAVYINSVSEASSHFIDTIFINNTVHAGLISKGGALFASGYGDIVFASHTMDSYYRGNLINFDDSTKIRGNAFCFETGYSSPTDQIINIDFKALHSYNAETPVAGSSIMFYDSADFTPINSTTVFYFNRSADGVDYLGRILFTGSDYQGDDDLSIASRTSTANDLAVFDQRNGFVQITDKAIVGAKEAKKYEPGAYEIGAQSYLQRNGFLQISETGHLLAKNYTLFKGTLDLSTGGQLTTNSFATDGDLWTETTLDVSDNTGTLYADTINLSRGARLLLGSGVQSPLQASDSGWQVSANSVTLGGTLGIADKNLDYYLNSIFATSQNFLIFKGVNNDTIYDEEGTLLISERTGNTEIVDYYEGTWSYKVVTNDDGTKDLFAVWTRETPPIPDDGGDSPSDDDIIPGPDGDPSKINPELIGSHVENSLWSTQSSMKSMSNLALNQLGYDRYTIKNCRNYWASTFGDFDMQRSKGTIPGYDYDGFGYAVGADVRPYPNDMVFGLAFGNLYGKNNSREFASRINQTTYIGQFYWGWLKSFSTTSALNLTGTASYGITNNKMKTYYSDGLRSSGTWDNNATRLTLNAEWLRDLGNDWTLAPFIGLEYDDITAENFKEQGARPRSFDKGHMKNLAMPVGLMITKQFNMNNGQTWLHRLNAAYVPDVYRDNPEATVTRNDDVHLSWTAHGLPVGRHAGRFEYSTQYVFNPNWSAFSGYSLETRTRALFQQVNLGASYSF